MRMVAAISGGLTVQVDWLGLRVGGLPALSLHSSNEPGELSQSLCHDDSTINIISVIIIIIITYVQSQPQSSTKVHHRSRHHRLRNNNTTRFVLWENYNLMLTKAQDHLQRASVFVLRTRRLKSSHIKFVHRLLWTFLNEN